MWGAILYMEKASKPNWGMVTIRVYAAKVIIIAIPQFIETIGERVLAKNREAPSSLPYNVPLGLRRAICSVRLRAGIARSSGFTRQYFGP